MRFTWSLCMALTSLALSQTAVAATLWNESLQGDLSNNQFMPTSLVPSLGSNLLIATSMGNDREYVTITLPDSTALAAINLVSYVGTDPMAFIAVQSGSTFTEALPVIEFANLLGWTHFGPGMPSVGTTLLDDLGTALGTIGFTGPLPGGQSYTFWIQQNGSTPVTYQLDFVLVPAPPAAAMLLLAVGRSRRRRQTG